MDANASEHFANEPRRSGAGGVEVRRAASGLRQRLDDIAFYHLGVFDGVNFWVRDHIKAGDFTVDDHQEPGLLRHRRERAKAFLQLTLACFENVVHGARPRGCPGLGMQGGNFRPDRALVGFEAFRCSEGFAHGHQFLSPDFAAMTTCASAKAAETYGQRPCSVQLTGTMVSEWPPTTFRGVAGPPGSRSPRMRELTALRRAGSMRTCK
jgi:hypothetical protein